VILRTSFLPSWLVASALVACSGPAPSEPVAVAIVDAGAPPVAALVPVAAAPAALSRVTGTVTLTRAGTSSTASPGPLQLADVLETGPASEASLTFPDGRTLELGENGRVEVGEAADDGLVLNIGQGVVVSRVRPTAAGEAVQLSLETPYGLVRVGSSALSLTVSKDEAAIDVVAGDVQLVSRQGQALELSAGAGGTLSTKGANRRVTVEGLTIILTQGTGRLELKKKTAARFTAVNLKQPPALEPGDTLRATQGTATLTPANSDARLTLLPGAEVGLGESATASGIEDLALELKKGQLQVSLPFGKKRTLRIGDGLTLTAENGGQLSVVRARNGLELTSIVGDVVALTEAGQTFTIEGGQTAQLSRAAVSATGPVKEALQLPTRQGLRLLHPRAERVALTWPAAEQKAWRITLGVEPSLAKPLIDGVVHQPFFNTLAPARGPLFWRIRDDEREVASGSVSCGPERAGSELGGISNEVPAGPEKTVIYFQDKPPSLTFSWKAPERQVARYQLKVYRAGTLATALQERTVATTTAQLEGGALAEGKYQWDVTWLDAKGTPLGTAGKMNQLELQYDNVVRALVIKSPRNGDPLAPKVTASGIAPLGARVTANGVTLPLDAKARFSTQVSPIAGGRVVFRSVGDGGDTFIVRALGKGAR
jgi:ferric-dicitrate binding protein FerR (iron transport regulator)